MACERLESTAGDPGAGAAPVAVRSLAPLLAILNALLGRAVERQAQWLGAGSLVDPWRGMHFTVDDVRAALSATRATADGESDVAALIASAAKSDARFARVAQLLRLAPIEVATVAFVLAPDVDLRYERVYAYLQDDVGRKRPSPDLLARLLCADADARAAYLKRFDQDAPLARFCVIEWPGGPDLPRLGRQLGLDPLWRNFLTGSDDLDPRLARCARRVAHAGVRLADAFVDAAVHEQIARLIDASRRDASGPRLVLTGPHGAGKARLSAAIAHEMQLGLLVLDLRDFASAGDIRAIAERAQRASHLYDALLCVHGVGRLAQQDPQALRALIEALAAPGSRFVLWLSDTLPQTHGHPLRALRIDLGLPRRHARVAAWSDALQRNGIECGLPDIEQVATRFVLSAAQIAQAAADVAMLARDRVPAAASGRELTAAARGLCGAGLAQLAQRILPEATMDALVTTPEIQAQLREICARVATRDIVRERWARGSLHARKAGITALFAGPSGTGKTLAAEVIAGELGYDLFRIDLAAVVSKYIGETEKNLDRVFAAAEHANAVLLFDEADALFGKRSEVKDAHDRYANLEIAYLLQKMEQFDGLAILSTNLKQNLDEAFARRLTFTVNFPFPEAAERCRLWHALWPAGAPRADDVDLAWFAQEFPMSGGNIRNAVLAAIHLAAAQGHEVLREHVMLATRREFQKLGKNLVDPAKMAARRVA